MKMRFNLASGGSLSLALISASLLLPACSDASSGRAHLPPASVAASPTPVRVAKPSSQTPSGDTRVTVSVRSKNEATLSAKTTGQILDLAVRVGDRVKPGQTLVRIDASMASISLQNARAAEKLALANLGNATTEAERAKALHDQGALADAVYDKSRMALDIASAQVDQTAASKRAASQQISDATIRAPFAGVVSARFKNAGDSVSGMPPTPLLTLVDPDHLEVRMAVPEALAPMLHLGDLLPATASPSGTPFQVRVSALGAAVDPQSRTVEVLADVVAPADPSLRPGTLATAELAAAPSLAGLYLPATSVITDAGRSYVFVVQGDRLQRKQVVATSIKPGTALVTEGLSANDLVALGASGLREGEAVRALAD